MKLLYPGSFNPFHNGHYDILSQMRRLVDIENAYIGVAVNADKSKSDIDIPWTIRPLMPFPDRVVEIEGLTAQFVKEHDFDAVVRSMRNHIDFEYEKSMAAWNERIGGVQTIFLPCRSDQYLSSSALREIMPHGNIDQEITSFMPHIVYERYKTKKPMGIIITGPIGSGKSTIVKNMHLMTGMASSQGVHELSQLVGHKVCDEVMNMAVDKEGVPVKILDLDNAMRQHVTNADRDAILSSFRNMDDDLYANTLTSISNKVNGWEKMFPEGAVIEASALGSYMEYDLIPEDLVARFLVIELDPPEERIIKNLTQRYGSEDNARKIYGQRKHFYSSPSVVDYLVQ